ncbi:MAG: hypothetical protein ACRDZW_00560 [Acidimicrobiales bacterium]
MRRFSVRFTAAASAFFVTAAFSGIGAAAAATAEPTGVGTSAAKFSLVSLELGKAGSLLNLRVLADDALSTIDSLVSTPNAFSKLAPLSLTSQVLPVLNGLTASLPSFESRTPGGQGEVKGSALDFSQGSTGLPGLGALGGLGGVGGLLGGQLVPTSLTSGLDDKGARSGVDAALANLSILNGILNIKSVSNLLGTAAASPAATGSRGVKIDAISILNLGDLLKGLGLDMAGLPLGILDGLLKNLNLLGGLPLGGAPDLTSAIGQITGVLDPLLKTVTGSSGIVGQVVKQVPVVSGLLGNLPTQLPVLGSGGALTSTVQTSSLLDGTVGSLLSTLQGTLSGLLGGALNSLGGLSLLSLDGADVNVATKAARSLDDSTATAVAQLGGLNVLGLKLPGVDLALVGNLVNTVTGTLGGVLSIIDPSFAKLLDLKLLDKQTNVLAAGGYNKALASFDVLSLTVNPLAGLSGIVGNLLGAGKSSSPLALLGAAGVASPAAALPVIGGNMAGLNGLLNLGPLVGALTEGLSLKIGSMTSNSELATAAAAPAIPDQPVPAPAVTELPRTGASTGTFAAVAAGLVALSLGVRRWSRRPSYTD